jgi:hypothetical protein
MWITLLAWLFGRIDVPPGDEPTPTEDTIRIDIPNG